MRLDKMLQFQEELKDLNFIEAFKTTQKGAQFNLNKVTYDDGLYTFELDDPKHKDLPLETITIRTVYTFGVVISLTLKDHYKCTQLHNLILDNIYRDIRKVVIAHTANKLIKKHELHDCLKHGYLTKQQFSILKPYKQVQLDNKLPYIFINKLGVVTPSRLPFTPTPALCKKLQSTIVKILCPKTYNSDED